MASRSVSPGAALLRSSRMFSMPNPIPASPGDYSSATKHHSATATIPYPTHLTITTPSTSRVNGDWGLKRPLPLKTTTKQTIPLVRVRQMDSREHVTDFRSASDHTMTLKKFQELNLPVSVPAPRANDKDLFTRYPKSVFEEDGDVTAIDPEQAQATENKRWKFKGPWLAGMTDGEFNKWLEKNVRAKRAEFRAYLKEIYAKELNEDRKRQAIRDQAPIPPDMGADGITDHEFMEHLRDLRQDRLVLFRHVSRFLDLAPLTTNSALLSTMKLNRAQQFDKENPYSTNGPPITHPSAGLSYLRTPNFIDNHPIYGPQKYHPPVKARIMKPRHPNTGVHEAIVGVAGIIADRATDQKMLGYAITSPRATTQGRLELEKRGGAKLYYKLDSATIDSSGRIRINVADPGHPTTELVVKELLGEDGTKNDVYMHSMQAISTQDVPRNPRSHHNPRKTHLLGSRESYGLGRDIKRT